MMVTASGIVAGLNSRRKKYPAPPRNWVFYLIRLTRGVSASKVVLSPHGHIVTPSYIPVSSPSSQMDSQFGSDRKRIVGLIRDVMCLEEFCKMQSRTDIQSDERLGQSNRGRFRTDLYKYHCDILI